jgi:hypothetical protein
MERIKVSIPVEIPVASTIDELMSYQGEWFVECAYQTILGRAADPVGMKYYLGRLRAGYSKVSVLKQLLASSEAKAHQVVVSGLKSTILRHGIAQYPIAGWILGIPNLPQIEAPIKKLKLKELPVIGTILSVAKYTDSDHFSARKARGLEFRLNQIETGLKGESPSGSARKKPISADIANKLSLYAQEIYSQLSNSSYSSSKVK